MRSSQMSLKLPNPIRDALQEVCVEENYKNLHACVIGALIEKVQNHRRTKWVHQIAGANPKTQDYLLDKMLAFPLDIDEAVAYFKRAEGPTSPKATKG